ncbi:MAG: RNase III inhibitor, partial [Dehalococcoidia bacterium]|nr:RNase III inhibitor [Dehalococcoidia bacterium]
FLKERATRIAVREVRAFHDQDVGVERLIFVCFSERDFDMHQRVLHMASN